MISLMRETLLLKPSHRRQMMAWLRRAVRLGSHARPIRIDYHHASHRQAVRSARGSARFRRQFRLPVSKAGFGATPCANLSAPLVQSPSCAATGASACIAEKLKNPAAV